MIVYETERLIIRRFSLEDQENIFLLNGNEKVMRYIRPVSTKDDSNKRLQEIITKYASTPNEGGWAVILKSTNEFIGLLAVFPIENSTDIQLGYSLIPKFWGNGYATEMAAQGVKHAFEKIGLSVLKANCETNNHASLKVLQKLGFTIEKYFKEMEKELVQLQLTKEHYFNKQL